MFYDTDIWANFIKLFSSSLKLLQKAGAFLPGKRLKSSMMCASEAIRLRYFSLVGSSLTRNGP